MLRVWSPAIVSADLLQDVASDEPQCGSRVRRDDGRGCGAGEVVARQVRVPSSSTSSAIPRHDPHHQRGEALRRWYTLETAIEAETIL